MQSVAQAWLVYRLTNSALLLGVVAFWGQISVFLLTPVTGVVADKYSRRHILICTQISAMGLSFVLAALTLSHRIQLWQIFLLAALLGIVNAFDFPVRQAFVSDLVKTEERLSAVTLNSAMINSARTIGPGIAGLLVALIGEGWCFFANAVSYVGVIIGLCLITTGQRKKARTPTFRAGIREAAHFVTRTGPVGALLLLLGLISVMGMRFEVMMPVIAGQVLQGGPTAYGLLMGASGIGAILGSLCLAMLGRNSGLSEWVGISSATFGLALVFLGFSHTFAITCLLMMLIGFTMVAQLDSSNTLVQAIVPDELRGRVMAIWTMMLTGLAPFGSLLIGGLAHRFSVPRTLAAGGMACMMGSLAFGFCQPILKHEARRLMLKRQREDGHQEIEMGRNIKKEISQVENGE